MSIQHPKSPTDANISLYEMLPVDERELIDTLACRHRLTFQDRRLLVQASRDLTMWGEGGLRGWWRQEPPCSHLSGIQLKKHLVRRLQHHIAALKAKPKEYSTQGPFQPKRRERKAIVSQATDKKIFGMCPVASERTVCCNLRTIDVVENCVFGCSYCSVQTFYGKDIVFDRDLAAKLEAIELEPDRFYHIGTGQSSDALAWGNRDGILDALCRFAEERPNILMELKTKSKNVDYLLRAEVPRNIVCTWSMNTPEIIANEEHYTADVDERIEAARSVADRGIKVGFHFHPMVYYQGWNGDYPEVASRLIDRFSPDEVLFISFGSVTLTKPVIKKIRDLGNPTKILQMTFVSDPHGKQTYPDRTKIEMFTAIHESLRPWHDRVFMYLCMEKRAIWEKTFGSAYASNEEFEQDFARRTMCKLENGC